MCELWFMGSLRKHSLQLLCNERKHSLQLLYNERKHSCTRSRELSAHMIYTPERRLRPDLNTRLLVPQCSYKMWHCHQYISRTQSHGNGFCSSVGRALVLRSRVAGSIPSRELHFWQLVPVGS